VEHESQIAYWRETARRLEAESERLRAERDVLAARVGELEVELEAAKAALVDLALELRHRSERAGKDKKGGEGEGVSSNGPQQADGEASEAVRGKRRRGQRPGAPGHGRRSYEHLPTEEIVHEPDELACPTCGTAYERLPGEEHCEELDWVVSLRRIVHRRPRYRRCCRCGGTPGIITAPPPQKAIVKGRFSSRFLARLVVAKFVVGLPCRRLIAQLELEGASFSAGSLAGVFASLAPLLAPLAEAIRQRNASAEVLHVDETSWPVFVELAERPNHRWWLWVFISADTVCYQIKPGRGAAVLAEHLGVDLSAEQPCLPDERSLVLCTDFYTSYQSLGAKVEGINNSWCWAHVRRHFLRAGETHPDSCGEWSARWIERIAALFKAHKAFALAPAGSAEEKKAKRALKKVLGEIEAAKTAETADPELPKAAAKVLAMVEREWQGLLLPVFDATLDLDNNVAERGLRSPVVGRKNYYGSGAAWSAQLTADAWTITATVAKAGWNPLAYLTSYLQTCAEGGGKAPQGKKLKAFLPWSASVEDAVAWQARSP
jgi:transposase